VEEAAAVEPLAPIGTGIPLAGARLLPIAPALAPLLPDPGLKRGTVLSVSGAGGATSLLCALVAQAMAEGSWAAVVGLPALGLEAAARLGLRLDHLALVPDPGAHWAEVVGVLVDSLDVVAVVPGRCRPADAHRLAARARERGVLLVVACPTAVGGRRVGPWPVAVDLRLEVGGCRWDGLGAGDGTLRRRSVTVRSSGRRAAARERRVRLWLPSPDGRSEADLPEVTPLTGESTAPTGIGAPCGP
jgi:hypothetical protein